jgi:hypothetical protein
MSRSKHLGSSRMGRSFGTWLLSNRCYPGLLTVSLSMKSGCESSSSTLTENMQALECCCDCFQLCPQQSQDHIGRQSLW